MASTLISEKKARAKIEKAHRKNLKKSGRYKKKKIGLKRRFLMSLHLKTNFSSSHELVFGSLAVAFYQIVFFSLIGFAVLRGLYKFFDIKDGDIYKYFHNIESAFLLGFVAVVFSFCKGSRKSRLPLLNLCLSAAIFILTKQAADAIPETADISSMDDSYPAIITLILSLLFSSLLMISINSLWALYMEIIRTDPTSKTSDALTAHAPSDLARDLRLSRSRARRSRVGR